MHTAVRRLGLGVAATLFTIFAAAPTAGAAVGDSFSICEPFAGTSLAPGASAVAARGGQIREPQLQQVHEDLPAAAKGRARASFAASVPVYFHVITDGNIGSLTTRHINDQMRVLNETFAGSATGFSFRLAGVTRTDNAAWFYAGPGGREEHAMKQALHQGGANALNLYSTTAGDFLGWAYLPDIVTKPGQAYLDGIVVDWESMPGTSTTYEGRFDEGKTATHEAGHWLNLEHTFYRGCSAKGDFVEDTPAQRTPTSGCPEGKDTCAAPGLDPIHNYMDYSDDPCYTEFTQGQTQRMRDSWLLYRAAG